MMSFLTVYIKYIMIIIVIENPSPQIVLCLYLRDGVIVWIVVFSMYFAHTIYYYTTIITIVVDHFEFSRHGNRRLASQDDISHKYYDGVRVCPANCARPRRPKQYDRRAPGATESYNIL